MFALRLQGCTTGECETWYHITRMSEEQLSAEPELLTLPELCDKEHVYEIVKNRDFDKCRVLPFYNYVSVQGLDCDVVDGAGCENKFSVSGFGQRRSVAAGFSHWRLFLVCCLRSTWT